MKSRIGRTTLAAVMLALFCIAPFVIYRMAGAAPLETYHSSWHLVRETAVQDHNSFAEVYDLTTEGNFANKNSATVLNGGPFQIRSTTVPGTEGSSPGAIWAFAICGKNYNNTDDTFSYDIVGWAKDNGMLQVIGEGAGALGTQAVVVYPDGGDAMGVEFSVTDANYTHATTTLSVTNGGFDGGVVNTMIYVGSSNETKLTSGYYEITTFTDANTIVISGASSTDNITAADVTVQNNPAFWADTITLDETTKWPGVSVVNSGDNEVAMILVDTTGLEWLQFVIYGADAATGEEAGDITVYGRRY